MSEKDYGRNEYMLDYLQRHAKDAQGKPLNMAQISRRTDYSPVGWSFIKHGFRGVSMVRLHRTLSEFPPDNMQEFLEVGQAWLASQEKNAAEVDPGSAFFFKYTRDRGIIDLRAAEEAGVSHAYIARARQGLVPISLKVVSSVLRAHPPVSLEEFGQVASGFVDHRKKTRRGA